VDELDGAHVRKRRWLLLTAWSRVTVPPDKTCTDLRCMEVCSDPSASLHEASRSSPACGAILPTRPTVSIHTSSQSSDDQWVLQQFFTTPAASELFFISTSRSSLAVSPDIGPPAVRFQPEGPPDVTMVATECRRSTIGQATSTRVCKHSV
jgi:hypothetical protein